MTLLLCGIALLISFAILMVQFYLAAQKGCNSAAEVVLKRASFAILNQRHLVSGEAMLVAALLIGFFYPDWLLLHGINTTKALLFTLAAAVAAGTISTLAAKKALRDIPVAAIAQSSGGYLLYRAFFLIVYEIFFRGVLLTYAIALTGSVIVAITINVILYALAHAFSTRQELIGTVPFGVLLCVLTLFSGSVWPAVLIHLLLGMPYDVLLLTTPKRLLKTPVI